MYQHGQQGDTTTSRPEVATDGADTPLARMSAWVEELELERTRGESDKEQHWHR